MTDLQDVRMSAGNETKHLSADTKEALPAAHPELTTVTKTGPTSSYSSYSSTHTSSSSSSSSTSSSSSSSSSSRESCYPYYGQPYYPYPYPCGYPYQYCQQPPHSSPYGACVGPMMPPQCKPCVDEVQCSKKDQKPPEKKAKKKCCRKKQGLNFDFLPHDDLATEVTMTIEPDEPEPLQYAMENGIMPIICCYMPSCLGVEQCHGPSAMPTSSSSPSGSYSSSYGSYSSGSGYGSYSSGYSGSTGTKTTPT